MPYPMNSWLQPVRPGAIVRAVSILLVSTYPIHPIAKIYPPLSAQEFAKLKEHEPY